MTNRMQYQLEQTGETATLYLSGGLGDRDLSALVGVCDALPSTIRTFRLDLHAIGVLSAESTGVVRQVLQHWRTSRRGEFRLSTKHLVATCRQAAVSDDCPPTHDDGDAYLVAILTLPSCFSSRLAIAGGSGA